MKRARVHDLYERPLTGPAIEQESLRQIDAEAPDHSLLPEQWHVARRLIHTTADFGLLDELDFSPDAIASGIAALQAGAPIYIDANMIAAGLSLARLKSCNPRYERRSLRVHVADPDVTEAARTSGLPRAVHALRKAALMLPGAIVCFGNSPVGLLELNRMLIEDSLRVALVVAMPVGFVHVRESKQELLTLPVPRIVLGGRRGGSPLAVATIHALCELATGHTVTSGDTQRASAGSDAAPEKTEAILLLGHGSRVPEAGHSMYAAAELLRARHPQARVEVCFMSRLGPHLPEVFNRCVEQGARRVIVVPYFLHGGLHIQLDIPEILRECAAMHPGVNVVLAERLGFDGRFVDVIEERIAAADSAPDVRTLALPTRNRFPVPEGQDEFVPMSPELAAHWRRVMQEREEGLEA